MPEGAFASSGFFVLLPFVLTEPAASSVDVRGTPGLSWYYVWVIRRLWVWKPAR